MAIVINETDNDAGRQPSAPAFMGKINVDLDAAYAAGGYDVSESLPDGITIIEGNHTLSYDGSALYHLRIENGATGPVLKVYDNDNGAPGAETVTADQSGHTGVDVPYAGY
jgi:hypothetical protein